MEGDLKSMVQVSACVVASMTYARFAAAIIPPSGGRLLVALLPVLCLLPFLPFLFSSIHLRGISAFFLVWLGIFKLLLLSAARGPLSPSLPLPTFIAAASLPVASKSRKSKPPPPSDRRLLVSAVRFALLVAIISMYRYRHRINPYLLLCLYCCHLYLALELVLSFAAFLVGALFGLALDPQFDAPFRAATLKEFWGRRWNLMVTGILRPSVYDPVRRRWGDAVGVIATFAVSALMHEVMFYYLTLEPPTGEVGCFFLLHGLCTVAETAARRAVWWRPNRVVAVPMTLGFVAVTGFWLFFPQILKNGTDERMVAEYAAGMDFLENAGRVLAGRVGLTLDRT